MMVDQHLDFVSHTLRRAGVPSSDLDDEVQRTFIVAARRLDDVQPGSERSFLYRVALNTAAHVRRTKARRREVMDGRIPETIEAPVTPEQLTGRKEIAQLLQEVAACMDETLYRIFKLFAYEEADVPEIARRLGIPRGTAASRLRRMRAHFQKHLGVTGLASALEARRPEPIDDPAKMSSVRISELMRALLDAGRSPRASASVRVGTLAGLAIAGRPEQSSRAPGSRSHPKRRTRRPSDVGRLDTRSVGLSRVLP